MSPHTALGTDADPPDPLDPLDPLVRLQVLASALAGSVTVERTIAAPFERVWRIVSELEDMVPRYEDSVAAVEVTERNGERAHILVTLHSGHVEAMHVRLRPGWCLMHSATTTVAFAARPAGEGTVLAHLEHNQRTSPDAEAQPATDVHAKLARELETIELLANDLEVS